MIEEDDDGKRNVFLFGFGYFSDFGSLFVLFLCICSSIDEYLHVFVHVLMNMLILFMHMCMTNMLKIIG